MIYNLIAKLKAEFLKEPFCNTVTEGDIFDVDLNKKTIFPLTHIMVTGFQRLGSTISISASIICMDIIDESKTPSNNKVDIWNQQTLLILRILGSIEKGYLNSLNWQLTGASEAEFFTERFENNLAGVEQSFTFVIPNDMSIC